METRQEAEACQACQEGCAVDMMLEPCPFRNEGKAHSPRLITAVGEVWVLCTCGATGKSFSGLDAEEKAIAFWNTRYKRTCKMERFDPYIPGLKCSACGIEIKPIIDTIDSSFHSPYKFCPNCGAEVVDGD